MSKSNSGRNATTDISAVSKFSNSLISSVKIHTNESLIHIGTNTLRRLKTLTGLDETAVQYSRQCIAVSGDNKAW